jgi:hypothetical protein
MACLHDNELQVLNFLFPACFYFFGPLWGGEILLSSFQFPGVDGMVGKRGQHLFTETLIIFSIRLQMFKQII